MDTIDIIPDIHGQIDKLGAALANLGWQRRPAGWGHPEPRRRIQFLGDFIDRGTDNRAVIRIVSDLVIETPRRSYATSTCIGVL